MASAPCAPQPNHGIHKLRVILPPRCYEKATLEWGARNCSEGPKQNPSGDNAA